MKKKFAILLIFWWSIIFPSLSFNNITTSIVSENVKYSDLYKKVSRDEIIKNAEYTFWILEFGLREHPLKIQFIL